jgi:Kdo2-lipid IVA lauroyltransferase/acyltransferase
LSSRDQRNTVFSRRRSIPPKEKKKKKKRKSISAGKRFRFRLEVAAMRALVWFLPKLSRRAVRRTGETLGWLAYYVAARERRIALANLDIAFGDTKTRAEKIRIARASLQNVVATVLGLFWLPRLKVENLEKYVEADPAGFERARQIIAKGQGIVFITLHYGDWEVLGQATALLGRPFTVVTEEMANTGAQELLAKLRERPDIQVIPQRFAAARLLKTLKRGGCVALLADLAATEHGGGVWVDFFGLPTINSFTPAALSLHTGAAIICGTAHPMPDGRVHVNLRPPIEYTPSGDRVADLRQLTQKCLSECEDVIRQHPEYWLWCYKRWKHRPTREMGDYPFYSRIANPGALIRGPIPDTSSRQL